jgi:hypothetical protein
MLATPVCDTKSDMSTWTVSCVYKNTLRSYLRRWLKRHERTYSHRTHAPNEEARGDKMSNTPDPNSERARTVEDVAFTAKQSARAKKERAQERRGSQSGIRNHFSYFFWLSQLPLSAHFSTPIFVYHKPKLAVTKHQHIIQERSESRSRESAHQWHHCRDKASQVLILLPSSSPE